METLPWYKSAIIRQQIVQLLIAATAFFGITSNDIDWDATVGSIFAGVAAITAVWTIFTRIFKPAPNLTSTAAVKEKELTAKGEIPRRQGGFALLSVLSLVLALGIVVSILAGCTGTRAAYKAADSLPDQAYVVAEHYAAIVKQAADLAENAATPESVKDQLKAADNKARPLVLLLKELAAAYQATRTAETEADLQGTLDKAVVAVADLIRAVKAARGEHARSTDVGACGAAIGRARTGIAGTGTDVGRSLCFG